MKIDPFNNGRWLLFPLPGEAEEQLEEIDEVQVEGERTEHRHLAVGLMAEALGVLLLDGLRVVGGETRKHEHADDRDRELQQARSKEEVDQRGDDDADQ